MANIDAADTIIPFPDFPEDVQLCILSFLTPSEISSFACTSKRFLSLCRNDSKIWFSMCDRRWGSKTQIKKWGSGKITFKHLYKTLHEYENLIGFWRLSSNHSQVRSPIPDTSIANQPPALVFFEWGPSFITGSRVSPSTDGGYSVLKAPFIWMGISPKGDIANYLEPNSHLQLDSNWISSVQNDLVSSPSNELVTVDINHIGEFHIVIEERVSFGNVNVDSLSLESGSPTDRMTSEIYQYFANRTSPGGERAWRRQRRRERERQGNKKWDAEHFIKIVNYSPTDLRPLQGLWKGFCEESILDFYLVAYDDIGGIACRRIGDSCKPFSSYSPVFWTSNTTFVESPFSSEEGYIYDTREHLLPPGHLLCSEKEAVSRILYINSSYDLVIPGLAGPTTGNPHQVEGRIWQYDDGTFGFGFLRDNHIIDLKHIAVDGCLLDATHPL